MILIDATEIIHEDQCALHGCTSTYGRRFHCILAQPPRRFERMAHFIRPFRRHIDQQPLLRAPISVEDRVEVSLGTIRGEKHGRFPRIFRGQKSGDKVSGPGSAP